MVLADLYVLDPWNHSVELIYIEIQYFRFYFFIYISFCNK